ncbi:MAG: dephospho-CoA kinase [Dehalococcoidia bacterium]
MYVIGLTGGIGSGKSTVAEMLEKKGAALLSADLVGHEVYQLGRPAWQELVDAFGRQVVAADGTIDRKALGGIVFSDRDSLQRLNAITHPRMKELMGEKLSELEKRGVRVTVLEAALLFDANWDGLTDEVWVTVVPPQVAAERAAERSKISVEQALARIKAQMSDEERRRRSRVILNTDCDIEVTRAQIGEEWGRLEQRLVSAAATGQARSGQEEA